MELFTAAGVLIEYVNVIRVSYFTNPRFTTYPATYLFCVLILLLAACCTAAMHYDEQKLPLLGAVAAKSADLD